MGLAISLAVYLDRRTLAQNHLILGKRNCRKLNAWNQLLAESGKMGFLGKLHRNLGDSSKVGAVCVAAPVRICAGAISDDRPYRVTWNYLTSLTCLLEQPKMSAKWRTPHL